MTDKYNVLRPVIWRGQVADLIVEYVKDHDEDHNDDVQVPGGGCGECKAGIHGK